MGEKRDQAKRGEFVTVVAEGASRRGHVGRVIEIREGHPLPVLVRHIDGVTLGYAEREVTR